MSEIRELNRLIRKGQISGVEVAFRVGGQVTPQDFKVACLKAVSEFEKFDAIDDPFCLGESGKIEVDGMGLRFRILHFDVSMSRHSSNPLDDLVTRRVLMIYD